MSTAQIDTPALSAISAAIGASASDTHSSNAIGARGLRLNNGQQAALEAFTGFLLDPNETVFVLKGYAGTGKSTLVETIIERLPQLQKMALAMNPDYKEFALELTATTNKACEALQALARRSVITIQSFLGLIVVPDPNNPRRSTLEPKGNPPVKEHYLLVVDEASYVDRILLDYIFKFTANCKIVFMGDPAQLLNVGCFSPPVFDAKGFMTAELTEVMRQDKGNPIMELSAKFRETVNTGRFFSFRPDGQHIQHVDRMTFERLILEEMGREDWKNNDSKILTYTNKRAIYYNKGVREIVKGDPNFAVGDYAINNKYITDRKTQIKTDQLVCLTEISEPVTCHGVRGRYYTIDGRSKFFGPASLSEWKSAMNNWQAEGNLQLVAKAEREWIDLRAAFAQTINKSQGSTYDIVFIDLDDVRTCNLGNQIARMMYVGISRARHQVFLTGDLA